jgi:predicted DCC family thiol-disulfide oxidoreductase YuxK
VTRQFDILAPHSETHLPLVFFDGGCPLCRREIAHYQRIDTAQRLCWVDVVSEPEALDRHGLSLEAAMAELQAYRWLARFITALGLRRPLAFAYRHFAAWRNQRRCGDRGCAANSGM